MSSRISIDNKSSYWDHFKTGDLCINKTYGKFASFIRGFTISEYNHSCTAIRLDPSILPEIKIVRTGGVLLFLEIDRLKEYESGTRKLRTNFMDQEKVIRLPLKDEYYTKEFEQNIQELIYMNVNRIEIIMNEHQFVKKPENFKSDIMKNGRNGIPKVDTVCSEISADFYNITLNKHINKNIKPALVFVPQTFRTPKGNPYFHLFEKEELVYDKNVSDNGCWLQLFLGILFVIIILIILFLLWRAYRRRKKVTIDDYIGIE
jgi:hypothetical protein